MNWTEEYKSKLVSVEECAKIIKSGDTIAMAAGCSAPKDLMESIAERYQELENVNIVSGLLMYPFPHLDKKFIGHIKHTSIFLGPVERFFLNQKNIDVVSYQFSETENLLSKQLKCNVAIIECSKPDEKGFMSFGPLGTFSNRLWADNANTVIVQVNEKTPYVYGQKASIHVSEVDYICEKSHDLAELPASLPDENDKKIAEFIIKEIPDGATIQLGLGNIANAVGYLLNKKNDLGVHTEMLTESMVELAKKGVINCSKKTFHPGKILCGFGIGTKKLYEFMDKNEMIETAPISYVNNIQNIAKNDNFMSINNALTVDLTGQVCSETLGYDMYSGTGGQLDFARGARLSNGGKSFIALKSTAKTKAGVVSRISSSLQPGTIVTTPRTDVQYIVTEYGIADLFNKSISERTKMLIKIAHPDFRSRLENDAKETGLI